MEKKFTEGKIGFDSAEGSDKLACSLIIVCENEKELQEKVKIASAAPALLDALIVMHLNEENRDIIHCPKCHQPVAYSPMIPVSGETEFTCKCGHTFIGVL